MKNKVIKISALILILLSLLSFVGCDAEYSDWELSEDETVLTESPRYTASYYFIGTLIGYELSGSQILYDDYLYSELKDRTYRVYSPDYESDTVYLYNSSSKIICVYAKEGGGEAAKSFIAGNSAYTRLINADGEAARDIGEVGREELDNLVADTPIDVERLLDRLVYEVKVFDATGTLSRTHGGIYELEGAYLYVNYDALDNSCFNADGSFSYRSGSVNVAQLDPSLDDLFDEEGFEHYNHFSLEYEEGIYDEEGAERGRTFGLFVISLVIAVFAFGPCALALVFMIVDLARNGFKRTRATTYVIGGAALVGIVCEVLMIVLFFHGA